MKIDFILENCEVLSLDDSDVKLYPGIILPDHVIEGFTAFIRKDAKMLPSSLSYNENLNAGRLIGRDVTQLQIGSIHLYVMWYEDDMFEHRSQYYKLTDDGHILFYSEHKSYVNKYTCQDVDDYWRTH